MSDSPEQTSRGRWLGAAALILCATLWSLNGPLIKLLTQAGVPYMTTACYRSLFGGVIFVPFLLRSRRTFGRVHPGWTIGSVLAFTLMTACFVAATAKTAAANAIILQYTSPIWVFLLSPLLLHERLRRSDVAVLAVAMVGVCIIFFGNATGDAPALVIGLASGLGYGSLTVALRGLRRVDSGAVVAMNFLGSGLILLPAVAVWGAFTLNAYQATLIGLLSVVQFALPYLLFSWALQRIEAHRAALIVLLETVLNPLLTYLLVGEAVPGPTLVGGPLILLSVVVWMILSWRRRAATA